jgi:hypothetical protein
MKFTLKLIIILFLAAGLGSCGKNDEKNETKNESNVEQKQTEQVQQNSNGTVQQNDNGDVKDNSNGEVQETQQNQQTQQTDSKTTGDKTTENIKNEPVKDAKIKVEPDEKKFVNDPKGQWPYDVDASSTRANKNDDFDLGYSNIQMIGKPNVKAYGDDKNAWSPAQENKGSEWIRASYTKTVNATEVRVRQNMGPGAITKVELFDDKGQSHLIWEGKDDNKYEPNKIEYFVISFPKTSYKVKSVKLTLATDRVPGWNEIDAVQLIGE